MSVPSALEFIQRVRNEETIQEDLRSNPPEDWQALVDIAQDMELSFTVEELKEAFGQDWSMRWLRYHSQKGGDSGD